MAIEMTPFVIGNIQFILSLLIYSFLAVWYVHPKLKGKSWNSAVLPLLFVHAFRYGPLTLLMPGQVDPAIDIDARQVIAYGDLISGILAIITMIFSKYNLSGAKAVVWVFSLIGIADIVWATKTGVQAGLLIQYTGFNLYILNFYVPMLIVTHIMIIKYLLKKQNK